MSMTGKAEFPPNPDGNVSALDMKRMMRATKEVMRLAGHPSSRTSIFLAESEPSSSLGSKEPASQR